MTLATKGLLLTLASLASAQYGPRGPYGPGGGGWNTGPWGGGSSNGALGGFQSFLNDRQKFVIAHGVLAALAFVIFFPMGSILIRLGSFRGLWLVHGLFQIFAYLVFIAAFGIGVWLVNNAPIRLVDRYHPIIGIVAFVLLAFQPILGLIHHFQYKKYSRRTIWSHGHLWLGRIVITLGIINGGLGMLLATETGTFVPTRGQMAAYGVVAAIMWVLWVVAAVLGERRRSRATRDADADPPPYKEQYS